ncbi:hypothetical protein FHS16_002470 [Paenibacillus endophyticus]|uniref:Uncharacterized protein n=1 Tax=Paenibacillus endophyticus TaxID=1294268 RepID=A0A7W5C769_9BACL|nr:hypothetical protein [Paenibacillus endophyticus]MBB3152420.1 hypothetical protein [Paenibacillus endophyticus]
MDHRDRIESPSVERRKLIQKRMEMIASLMSQMNEGESQKKEEQPAKKRKRTHDCYGINTLNWLGRFVTTFQRMFS